jgi:hypothetical protein
MKKSMKSMIIAVTACLQNVALHKLNVRSSLHLIVGVFVSSEGIWGTLLLLKKETGFSFWRQNWPVSLKP